MRTTFPAYYRPSEELLRELWQKATIALDANVLLNLYRYPIQARNDLLSVLRRVSGRLFVPYQAALEYQRQRLHVIALQSKGWRKNNYSLRVGHQSLASAWLAAALEDLIPYKSRNHYDWGTCWLAPLRT